MSVFFVIAVSIIVIVLSKILFHKWFNHLAIYTGLWGMMLSLYELKFLRYIDLRPDAWLVVVSGFLAFLLGIVTYFAARGCFPKKEDVSKRFSISEIPILADGGKVLKAGIWIAGIIGLAAAIQNWIVLFKYFGNIQSIFLAANQIYRTRVESEIPGVIPYVSAFSGVGIVLSGIYTAYKNRITMVAILPIVGSLLKSLAMFGRIWMLLALVQFVASLVLFKSFMKPNKKGNKTIIISLTVIFLLFVTGASLVKNTRGTYEVYKGASKEMQAIRGGVVISPSVYLYMSAHIGVLSKYLEEGTETAKWGQYTFSPFYNVLAKFGLTERVPFDSRGYFIPMWTNSGTYLRDLHVDFGVAGIWVFPYLLGLISTFLWFKFYSTGGLRYFVILVHLYVIVSISFITIATRGADWYFGLGVLIIIMPFLEKLAKRKSLQNNNNSGQLID
ncbi:MAG: O-antigen polymerase [Ignavibacteriales bacterium]